MRTKDNMGKTCKTPVDGGFIPIIMMSVFLEVTASLYYTGFWWTSGRFILRSSGRTFKKYACPDYYSVPMNHNLVIIMGKDACIYEKLSPCDGYDTSKTPSMHLRQISKLWSHLSCSSPGIRSLESKVSVVKLLEILYTSTFPPSPFIKVSEKFCSTHYWKTCNLLPSDLIWQCNMYFSCNSHQHLCSTHLRNIIYRVSQKRILSIFRNIFALKT